MEYLNQFHKEDTEKGLKAIAEMKKSPVNYEEELTRHKKMHKIAQEMEDNLLKEKDSKS